MLREYKLGMNARLLDLAPGLQHVVSARLRQGATKSVNILKTVSKNALVILNTGVYELHRKNVLLNIILCYKNSIDINN
jgi:hypothetical protein